MLEDEADFKTKLTEARRLQRQLSYSLLQQQRTMSPEQYQKTLKGIKDELTQMKSQISQLSQQMSSFPRFRGRFMSTYAQEQYNELTLYRTQLQMQVNQESTWLNQLQSQKADPKAKDTIDAQVRDRRAKRTTRRFWICERWPTPSPRNMKSSPKTPMSRMPFVRWARASETSRGSALRMIS